MSQTVTISCDVCGRAQTEETHWFVVVTSDEVPGIAFGPSEAQYADGVNVEHICGSMCMHIRLTQWAEQSASQEAA